MGKASRLKAERKQAPPPIGKKQGVSQRAVILGTVGVVIVAALVAGGFFLTRSTAKAPPPSSTVAASDRNAPAALVAAANRIGFSPNTEAGVGTIESKPASAAHAPSNPALLAVGTKAPAFTLKTPLGFPVSLSDFRGRATLLEFFATWCPHCDAEAANIRDTMATLPKSKYAWVSINADGETAPSVFAYHRYFGLSDPVLLDPSGQPGDFRNPGAAGPVTTSYQVQAFPTFYVVDPKGVVTWRSDGEQPNALIKQELLKAARA
jgi:peroxiredoxin